MINLNGKKALVCGSSKGIGYAIADIFNQSGAFVTLISSNKSNLLKAQASLKFPENSDFIVSNFDDYNTTENLVVQHIEKNGNYDILINNSGGPAPGKISEAETQNLQTAIYRHLFTSHLLTKSVLPNMKKNEFGRIINIISISVKEPVKNLGVSNAVRGAMNSWAKTLSKEIAKYGITVNNILPGYTETERLKSLFTNIASQKNISYEEVKSGVIDAIPAKRLGQPEDVANLAAFLASDLSSYITGTNIPVDGGYLNGF